MSPGVNPPAWIESDDASLPTRDEDGGRCALCAIDGDATFVGSRDGEETASPQDEQKRSESETADPHPGQAVKVRRFYVSGRVGGVAGSTARSRVQAARCMNARLTPTKGSVRLRRCGRRRR